MYVCTIDLQRSLESDDCGVGFVSFMYFVRSAQLELWLDEMHCQRMRENLHG